MKATIYIILDNLFCKKTEINPTIYLVAIIKKYDKRINKIEVLDSISSASFVLRSRTG